MPKARFRLHSVTIEGFRGFTEPQHINFDGKHIFLFGENGCGKSSIVEAIRWCLFGLAERPETEVRNAYYTSGECMVDMELLATDGIWHILRRLRPGAERSRSTITNPDGKEMLQSQVFPYLARMGPKEGTHVIFAAQQAGGRRPQADISDFHKVLYSYLHLEEVPDLLERISKLLEEQQSVRDELASMIDSIEEGLRKELDDVTLSLEELLRHPPWGEGSPPTRDETKDGIFNFAEEIAKIAGTSIDLNESDKKALEKAEQLSWELAKTSREVLEKKLADLKDKTFTLENLSQVIKLAEEKQAETRQNIKQLEERLAATIGSQSLKQFEEKLTLLTQRLKESNSRLLIVKEAEEFCRKSPEKCPVCLADYTDDELIKRIESNISLATPQQAELSEEFNRLNEAHNEAIELDNQINYSRSELQQIQIELNDAISKTRKLLEIPENLPIDLEIILKNIVAIKNSLQACAATLTSKESQYADWKKHIDDFKSELRFHRYRDKQNELQHQLTTGLEPTRSSFAELVSLEDTLRIIKEKLEQKFNGAIDNALPRLNNMMTEVYRRLTGQISFENVHIKRTRGSSGQVLQIYVGSEQIKGQLFDPVDVLNGQAISALHLVPYFVFSQFQAEALELDLLLIDDPSQSFDTSHVEVLLQELANACSHAQLIIATHEEERFHPSVGKYFPKSDYQIFRFKEFDLKRGPSINVQHTSSFSS